jgi:hypothetical protein
MIYLHVMRVLIGRDFAEVDPTRLSFSQSSLLCGAGSRPVLVLVRTILFACAACMASVIAPRAAFAQLSAADTSAILQAVIAKYGSHNGLAIELTSTAACGDGRYHGHARIAQNLPCLGASVDSVIIQHARSSGLARVDSSRPLPECSWRRDPNDARRGIRLHIIGPAVVDGQIRAGMLAHCREARGGYFHSITYEIAKVAEEWRVVRVIASMIT